MSTERKWTEESIIALLSSNDRAVEKGIVAIYNRQTEDEKATQDTRHSNNIGFSGADASSGTYYAKWILSGKHLTGKHLARARKMANKYRKQLLSIALEKADKPTSAVKQVEVALETSTSYTSEEVAVCEECDQKGVGSMHYHMGTPVFFHCNMCRGTKGNRG